MLGDVADDSRRRLVGAANVPHRELMRVNVSWPLGALEIDGPAISLRVRWMGTGAEDLTASEPDDLREVYLVKALLLSGMGLGFRDHGDREFYFWPLGGNSSRQILESLRERGYHTEHEARKAAKRWRGFA